MAAPSADEVAIAAVAARCETLLNRSSEVPRFNEAGADAAYARWRPQFLSFVGEAGGDFRASLEFAADIPETPVYTNAQILQHGAGGAFTLSMPQMR